ncbi:MAG: glycoside hydrolase family 3 N-terminal domain-containing protein, partial [Gemmatimonadota bacterium]
VVAFIEGARSAGLLTVVKHFPGHGDTETDSHLELPVLDVDRFRLDGVELPPFRAAIRAGVDGVMTAHLAVPVLDRQPRPRPATLSPEIVTELLRSELGFGGLVVTDALHMDGVMGAGSGGEVAVAAIAAGADILLIPPDEADAIDAVVAAVRRGELSEERIDRSVFRILSAKAAAGLHRERRTNMASVLAQIGRLDHEAWGRRVAERSITLARAAPGALPIAGREGTLLAVLYDDRRNHGAGEAFERALAERGARVRTVRLSAAADAEELERVRRMATAADRTLFASFSRALPWKGELGLPPDVAALARDLAAAGAPVISFGDPYLLRQLPDVGTYLLAWSRAEVSQEATARALLGEIPVTGRLPIELPPGYGVGDGLVLPSLPGITTLPLE